MAVRSLVVALAVVAGASCGGAIAPSAPTMGAPGTASDGVLAHILASRDLDGAVVGDSDGAGAGGPPGTTPLATRATVVILFASWCPHCHDEIQLLDALRAAHPGLRVIGLNYRGHEEYDARGNAAAVRNYRRHFAPWMRVVPADERLFDEIGRPPKIPTMFVYDAGGALVQVYDRRVRAMPDGAELEGLLARLGA